MNLKNYTSSVPVLNSISKIEFRLSQCGATHIGKTYDNGKPIGIMFQININQVPTTFKIPAKIDKVFDYMLKQKKSGYKQSVKETIRLQADRTAWKILSDWVDIQISLIEIEQIEIAEAFLQYLYDPRTNRTFFEEIKSGGYKLLTDTGKGL